jgi:GTP-binding protein
MFTLAIVGRPNVGKSTLFNRLSRKKLAIIDDTPGVTRDWRESEGWILDRQIRLIDTAGLEESFDDSIPARMRKQTELAMKHADAILFLVDGRSGLTPMDKHFADWMRKGKLPVILGVNKCENDKAAAAGLAEAYSLGLGEPIPFSAAHGYGLEDLYNALTPYIGGDESDENTDIASSQIPMPADRDLDALEGQDDYDFSLHETPLDEEKSLRLAIVGRPNVGKSTLLNALVEEDRVMTGPEAGITRDAIAVKWEWQGRKFRLVDTAGMRRKSRIDDKIEKMSVDDTLRAIRLAEVVVLVLDAGNMFERQDMMIADHIISEGRAIVIAINKWDMVDDKTGKLDHARYRIEESLGQLKDVPVVTLSALRGKGLEQMLKTIIHTHEVWNRRVKTPTLNRWLRGMEERNPAPLAQGRHNRLRYITQIKARPPTFVMWVNRPDDLPETHKRFIVNGLRRDFDIPGVPIRLLIRASKNPYTD